MNSTKLLQERYFQTCLERKKSSCILCTRDVAKTKESQKVTNKVMIEMYQIKYWKEPRYLWI